MSLQTCCEFQYPNPGPFLVFADERGYAQIYEVHFFGGHIDDSPQWCSFSPVGVPMEKITERSLQIGGQNKGAHIPKSRP